MTAGVQVYKSTDAGAANAANVAGSRITNVFDPCLVNGYNTISVTSITRSGTTVTVTCAAAHGFLVADGFAIAEIMGAVQGDYNGVWKITPTSTTVFTYQIGTTPTTPATGTITVKRAGAGWTKVYTGTNLAAYLSPDGKCYLRVDDTQLLGARLRLYRTMSDVNTGTDITPTVAVLANGVTWNFNASVPWVLTSKGNFVNAWCALEASAGSPNGQKLQFGLLANLRSSGVDDYAYYISAAITTGFRAESSLLFAANFASSNGAYIMRSYTAASGAVLGNPLTVKGSTARMGIGGTGAPNVPDSISGKSLYDRTDIAEGPVASVRGEAPGVWIPMGDWVTPYATFDTFSGQGSHANRRFMILKLYNLCAVLFEISDTWDL